MSYRTKVGVTLLGDLRGDYGGRRVAERLLESLVERHGGSFEFHLYVSEDIRSWCGSETADRVRWTVVGGTAGRLGRVIGEQVGLARTMRREGVEAILAPNNVLPMRWVGPSVLMLQNVKAFQLPGEDSFAKESYRRRFMSWSVRRADRIVCVSQTIRREAASLWPDVEPRLTMAYNGVLRDRDEPLPDLVSPIRGRLLFVSALRPYKRVDVAVRALALLHERGLDEAHLVIAGSGGRKADQALAGLVEDLGLQGSVTHVGRAGDTLLAELYATSEVLVFPSAYESFGLPAAEAMARGMPVVYADTEALPEIVGNAGLPSKLGDADGVARACVDLMTDECLWKKCSLAGRERVRHYTWHGLADAVADSLDRAIAQQLGMGAGSEEGAP